MPRGGNQTIPKRKLALVIIDVIFVGIIVRIIISGIRIFVTGWFGRFGGSGCLGLGLDCDSDSVRTFNKL